MAKATALVLIIGGALCGLAGAAHVLGTEYRLSAGIAGSLGFDAITVALLGRSRPLGTFLAGLLFGGLLLMRSSVQEPVGHAGIRPPFCLSLLVKVDLSVLLA